MEWDQGEKGDKKVENESVHTSLAVFVLRDQVVAGSDSGVGR